MTHVYRASALGGCDKALIAARLGYTPMDPPEHFTNIFREGNLHEGAVWEWLKEQDWKVRDEQLEVVIDCPMDTAIVGHLDGIVTTPQGVDMVGEVKSMSKAAWDEFFEKRWGTPGLIQKYKWQLSSYMVAVGLPGVMIAKNRDNGKHLIVEVPKPWYDRTDLVKRVIELELAARKGLPEGCVNASYPCPFYYLHEDKDDVLLPPTANGSRLETLVSAYRVAQTQQRVSKELLDSARRELVAAMEGNKKMVTESGLTITRFMKKNPPRWDENAMIADGVDVAKYRSQTSSEQVRVTGD